MIISMLYRHSDGRYLNLNHDFHDSDLSSSNSYDGNHNMSLNSQQSHTSKSYKLTKSSKSSKSKCSNKLSKGDVMGKTDKSSGLKAKLTKGVKGESSKSNSDGDDKGYNSALELSALNRVNLSNDVIFYYHHLINSLCSKRIIPMPNCTPYHHHHC